MFIKKVFYNLIFTTILFSQILTVACNVKKQQACRMTSEYKVSSVSSKILDLNLLENSNNNFTVFWSEPDGVYFKNIDKNGIARADKQMVRLEDQHPDIIKGFKESKFNPLKNVKKISSVKTGKNRAAIFVAVENDFNKYTIYAALADISKPSIKAIVPLGVSHSNNISGTYDGEFIFAAFQQKNEDKTVLLKMDLDGNILKTKIIKSSFHSEPVIFYNGQERLLLYSKVSTLKKILTSVTVTKGLISGPENKIAEHHIDSISPFITRQNNGYALLFRDNEDKDNMEEFYYLLLDKSGKPKSKPIRISRSDGDFGPSLTSSDTLFFSAAIRSYRSNYLVGFNRFNKQGVKQGGEFQIYADKNNFTRVQLITPAKDKNSVLIVYAEQKEEEAKVLSATITCR
ncbi:MAG: hypothetical protein JXR91_00125 [Deltaproteobacteria bacterium]|nr:hypothetical protein [Deltaproteobacteria bacterium]